MIDRGGIDSTVSNEYIACIISLQEDGHHSENINNNRSIKNLHLMYLFLSIERLT